MSRHIGTAGWSIPKAHRECFGAGESILARYATRLNAVEINSSFYRRHKPATYARWAGTVPDDFRFAVKMPKTITHEKRLKDAEALLEAFLGECTALGRKLGPLLVQLPPSLKFASTGFFQMLRDRFQGAVVCEPRHPTWFAPEAEALLSAHRISRVAADPAPVPQAADPFGDIAYYRWHGVPRMYYSDYDDAALAALEKRLYKDAWVIFDNTALGHATANALAVTR
ncbi:MAG TPA: DUF72 domain-containing protein [Rhizomicrobium sp.]|jgi:uncharacterized protein YecE (DUF72 family)|nr:DUF72 domain-containing protein [Rhizomicrobium sp.]